MKNNHSTDSFDRSTPIEKFGFSLFVLNELKALDCRTLGDVCELDRAKLTSAVVLANVNIVRMTVGKV